MCAGIVGYSCHIFQLIRSIDYKWKFLVCATIAFSLRYVPCQQNKLPHIVNAKIKDGVVHDPKLKEF